MHSGVCLVLPVSSESCRFQISHIPAVTLQMLNKGFQFFNLKRKINLSSGIQKLLPTLITFEPF